MSLSLIWKFLKYLRTDNNTTGSSEKFNNADLNRAIRLVDIGEIKSILESGLSSFNGDRSDRVPAVLECVSSGIPGDKADSAKCEILKLLVHAGADIDLRSPETPRGDRLAGCTAALLAARQGYVRCLQFLVESGADLSITSAAGETILMVAAVNNRVNSVRYLIHHLSPSLLDHKDKTGKTALMVAASASGASKGRLQCLDLLVEAGAELDVQDQKDFTALMLAIKARNTATAMFLIRHGALVNTTSLFGETPLMLALQTGSADVVTLLMEKGALVNSVPGIAETPLKYALKSCEDETVGVLLERGAISSTVSREGETLLTFAKNGKMLKLLRHGLDPTLSRRDRHFVHSAIISGQRDAIRGLIMHGPISALTVAFLERQPDIAKYLIINRFFTQYDISRLCWESEIHQRLSQNRYTVSHEATQCLEILDFLSKRVLSLRDLCFITISSALSQDFDLDPYDIPNGRNRWVCTPTFRERVKLLPMPPFVKRELLHQTPSAALRVCVWDEIVLG
ncbi:ankyrin repeat protein [Elysia marginata]|uniref:Ankyrin repeat protein n=1 Tax=Elysia marginata TaxID=1093978 RepID=A0AAV4HNY4_9GAST|nr:ankyrin repeat protein [Elysia marginata]